MSPTVSRLYIFGILNEISDSKFKSKRKIVHTHLQKNEGNLWSKKMTLNWWKNLICVTLVHTIYMFLPFEDAIRKQSCSVLIIFHCAKTCYATWEIQSEMIRGCFDRCLQRGVRERLRRSWQTNPPQTGGVDIPKTEGDTLSPPATMFLIFSVLQVILHLRFQK